MRRPHKLLLLSISCVALQAHAIPPDPSYVLNWADEFNGTKLDLAAWNYRTDSKYWSTQLPANVTVHDGFLWLTLKKEQSGGKDYTGAGVISKRHFKFGYYEARFKVPPTKGWHTSFWMMKYDGSGGTSGRAAQQELDVCENDSINPNVCAADEEIWPKGTDVGSKWVSTPNLSADFHIWGCEFRPDKITYYFDGKVVATEDTAKLGKLGEQNIWLTAIASPMSNTDAVDDSRLPVYAVYDYVRFYKKK